jgi:hypothetical protein
VTRRLAIGAAMRAIVAGSHIGLWVSKFETHTVGRLPKESSPRL